MALVVETGTGRTDATAFVSVATFKAYCDARGFDYSTYSNSQIEQAIVRATERLSDGYAWAGEKVKGRNSAGGAQALAWPRTNVVDRDGYSVPSNSVPEEIQRATSEITQRELVSPNSMSPDVVPGQQKVLVQAGDIKWENMAQPGAHSMVPVLTVVRDLIGPLLATGGGSAVQGRAVRV